MNPLLFEDIIAGGDFPNPTLLGEIDGRQIFTTFDPNGNNTKLWRTDGTEAGTVLLEDFGSMSFPPTEIIIVGGDIFFKLASGNISINLYKTDGTAEGTFSIFGYDPRTGTNLSNLMEDNGHLVFTVDRLNNRSELWKSDGTIEGTVLIQSNITFGVSDGNPGDFDNVPGLPERVTIVPDGAGDIELPQKFNSNKFPSIVAIDGTGGNGGSDFPGGTAVLRDGSDGSNDRWNFSKIELKNIAYIDGGNGSDLIIGSQNADQIFGGADGDNLRGKKGDDTIEGGTGNDIIRGQGGNDLLLGETQGHPTENDDDILDGGAGNDILDGQNGDDILIGGTGKDKFVLSGDFDRDFIVDFVLDRDEIINTSDRTVKDVVLGSNSDSFKVSFNGSIDILTVNVNGNDQGELQTYLLNLGSNETLNLT